MVTMTSTNIFKTLLQTLFFLIGDSDRLTLSGAQPVGSISGQLVILLCTFTFASTVALLFVICGTVMNSLGLLIMTQWCPSSFSSSLQSGT